MKTKIPIGRTIFAKLNTKVTITRCNLEPNLRFFITFVWVDFKGIYYIKFMLASFVKIKEVFFVFSFPFFFV